MADLSKQKYFSSSRNHFFEQSCRFDFFFFCIHHTLSEKQENAQNNAGFHGWNFNLKLN